MRRIFQALFTLGLYLQPALAQKAKQKPAHSPHYFSFGVGVVAPLGDFDNSYHSGFGINGTMHFKGMIKSGEFQVITGYERFLPKRLNPFGAISIIPVKAGILQMISKEFYLYVRTGVLAVKDKKSPYSLRFSTDAGLGYAFRQFAVDIGFHGWVRKGGGFTNYFSAGVVLPFHRSN